MMPFGRLPRVVFSVGVVALLGVLAIPARAVTIEFVTVGNAGNANDSATGNLYGAVAYSYQIGKNDVTIGQYTAFLNAADPNGTNPNGIYNPSMGTDLNIAGILYTAGASAGSKYAVISNGGDSSSRPITYVSWFDAARFANWMTNGQGSGSTETGAYTLNGATSGTVPVRNPGAPIYIPTENEWYKAAYYSPVLNSGSGGYYTYATQSNTAPGNTIGGGANQANYKVGVYAATGSPTYSATENYLTDVGAFFNTASYYGTFDQSGNVFQWNDLDGTAGSFRGLKGGSWNDSNAFYLSSSGGGSYNPTDENSNVGFRLASPVAIPEPSTYAMALAGLACEVSMWRRRGNRQRTKLELNSARNRCQLACLTLVALSIMAAGAASTTSAAVIVWDTPQTITGDSDVNTSGSLVYAYNVGPSPTVSSTVTVSGVAFQPFPIINFPATNAFTFGGVTISESPGNLFGYDVASTSGSYGLLSPAYRALLDGGGGAGVPDTVTVSLGGLSLGQQYLFQWWASNAANISFVSTVTGLATNSVTLDSNLTNAAGGLGQFVTGTFTADGATQNITFTGAANSPLINAFQIRAVPEPSTYAMALAGIACGCYSMWQRRQRSRRVAAMPSIVAAACVAVGGSAVHAATVTWFGPSQAANSNATWTGTTSAQNYGVAFVSGTASGYSMDWLQLGLNTSSMTTGSGSLVIELRNTTNLTPYSAVSGTTVYAADTILFTCPTTQATSFTVNLAPANFPNISSFLMTGTTGYSLRLWGPSGAFGILRTTGYANGTTNNFYTVSDGFVALDTFRNNIANYTNTTNSYPTLSIAFGTTFVPEPSTCAMALAGLAYGGYSLFRHRKQA